MKASVRRSLIGDPKILDVLQDEAGKVWLFYAEAYSHDLRTVALTLEEHPDFTGIKFRYMDTDAAVQPSPGAGELIPTVEVHWGDGRPGWENSPEQQRLLKIADDHNLAIVQVVELPSLPQKKLRIVDE